MGAGGGGGTIVGVYGDVFVYLPLELISTKHAQPFLKLPLPQKVLAFENCSIMTLGTLENTFYGRKKFRIVIS